MLNREVESKIREYGASLEEKANDIEVRKKSIPITEYDISDTLKQQINGNAPISQTIGIGAVAPLKTTFMTRGKQLFNKTAATLGKYVIYDTGSLSDNASYCASDYIPITGGLSYYSVNSTPHYAWYNDKMVYISGSGGVISNIITAPTNAFYLRMSVPISQFNTYMLNEGTTRFPYEDYTEYIQNNFIKDVPISKVTGKFERKQTDFFNIKNLFDKTKMINNAYIDYGTGNVITGHATNGTTDFIPITPSTQYALTNFHLQHFAFYDVNKVYISNTLNNLSNPFTSPVNAYFVRLSLTMSNKDAAQIEEGNISTSYEPHVYKLIDDVFPSKLIDRNQIDIILPRKIYILKGDDVNKEQLNIYFKNLILSNSNYSYKDIIIDVVSSYGRQYADFWRIESNTNGYVIPTAPFALTIKVLDKALKTIMTKSCIVELIDKMNNTPVRHLAIGDSITSNGNYLKQFDKLDNIITQGIKVTDANNKPREGRGGWTLANYISKIATTTGDSPFVFPTNVEGNKYKGNTDFWKKVCYTDINGYDYQGYQKIARGWTGEDYLYDANGYYINPSIGDVMVDPSKANGSKWVEWDGAKWVAMTTQPTVFEFSFSKYLQRFASAFSSGTPTHVSILLGANDFQTSDGVVGIDTFINNLNIVINSIRAYSSTIKIIINIPTTGANQDAWGINVGCGGIQENYDRNMKLESQRLLKEFDTDISLSNNIYICPMGSVLDTVYGFDYQTENVNIYSTEQVKRYNNWVHPNDSVGHKQMGDALAGLIQKIR